MAPYLRQSPEGTIIALHVQPRASRTEIVGSQGEELKVRLTSPPVEGAANRLCTEFFARLLGVARSDVTVVAGEKSRHKRVLVRGLSPEEVRREVTGRLPSPS